MRLVEYRSHKIFIFLFLFFPAIFITKKPVSDIGLPKEQREESGDCRMAQRGSFTTLIGRAGGVSNYPISRLEGMGFGILKKNIILP